MKSLILLQIEENFKFQIPKCKNCVLIFFTFVNKDFNIKHNFIYVYIKWHKQNLFNKLFKNSW